MKKNLIRAAFLAPAIVASTASVYAEPIRPVDDRPNIIYIYTDDLGWGDIEPFGQTLIRTPALSRMADEGMRFTDHYASVPVCQPSRYCLMMGVHNGNSATRDNSNFAFPAGTPTMARSLQDAGYATAMFGKWGLGRLGTTGEPLEQGFDEFVGYTNQVAAHNYYPTSLERNRGSFPLPENVNDGRGIYSHDLFTAEALAFIAREWDKPFFLYLPYTIPHNDQVVPYDSAEEYDGVFPENPNADSDQPNASYAGQITRLDRDVCRILDKLVELGIEQNTLVIFDSDNGPTGIGGNSISLFKSNGPFRGTKRSLFEGGIRVPMIAWWPGTVPAATTSDLANVQYNFYPTFAELAGANVPATIDGRSIVPTLKGGTQPEQDFIYWEFQGNQAIRIGQYKGYRPNGIPGDLQIYDLAVDPGESNNIAASMPALVTQMNNLLDANQSADF